MISITNERGEPISFPPGGITIRDLIQNFGNMRLSVLPDVASQDFAEKDESNKQIGLIEEISGMHRDTDIEGELGGEPLTIIERATYARGIDSFTYRFSGTTAYECKLLVDGKPITPLFVEQRYLVITPVDPNDDTNFPYREAVAKYGDAIILPGQRLQMSVASSTFSHISYTIGTTRI